MQPTKLIDLQISIHCIASSLSVRNLPRLSPPLENISSLQEARYASKINICACSTESFSFRIFLSVTLCVELAVQCAEWQSIINCISVCGPMLEVEMLAYTRSPNSQVQE
jgi:hypothetical protein